MLIPISDAASDLGAEVGIIGGSGFSELLGAPGTIDNVDIDTPFGAPSATITVGTLAGRRVAFLPRHGRGHRFAPHNVPYQANIWALASLGVRAIIGPCSVGSLRREIGPGELVVVDQLVDRTWGRPDTFHDGDESVHHQQFADPYHPSVRAALLAAGPDAGIELVDGGTMVVINGPRFSTRAESRWFADMGWDVVNMTGYPEAVLAAEAGVPYATVALVTDRDVGVDGHEPVTMDVVLETVRSNVHRLRSLLEHAVPRLVAPVS